MARLAEVGRKLATDAMVSDERKQRRFIALGKQRAFLSSKRTKVGFADPRTVKAICKGAFGEVRVMQKVDTGMIYVAKTLGKEEVLKKDQIRSLCPVHVMRYTDFTFLSPLAHHWLAHVRAESNSLWVV